MALEEDIRKLMGVPLFSDIEPEALRLIAFSSEVRILRAGDILFRIGEPSDGGYIVQSGSIALDAHGDGGPPAHVVRANGLIGEIALITETERTATAVAREPSIILKISRKLFHRVLHEFPRSAARIRARLAKKTIELSAELKTLRTDLTNPQA